MHPPNIVQITCHDLGRHLGCYGVATVHTPALDRIAAEGVRFANSFCTSPGCSPSRAALATGRYPHQCGVMGLAHAHFGWQLAPGERHVAALLRDAGYHTALFGLQHVTYEVESLGFAEIHPDRPADAVAANLERFLEARPARVPFYAEINFFEPHRPFDFGGVMPDAERGVYVPPYLPDVEAVRGELAAMQGAIRKVDACVARIEAALARCGLTDDTLLLFTADHGIAFPRAKGSLYDSGIEAALILRWPAGGVTGGRVPGALVSNIDVLPTLLEAADAAGPENVEGFSLLPLVHGVEGPDAEFAVAHRDAVFAEKTYHGEYDPMRCIRTTTHKLIMHFEVANRVVVPLDVMQGPTYKIVVDDLLPGRAMLELYDLEKDPWEQRNLADAESHRELRDELGGRLRDWMQETDDPLLQGPIASPFYHRALEVLQGF